MYVSKMVCCAAAAAIALPASAATLDVAGLTSGSITDPTTVTDLDTGVGVTFTNPSGEGLRFANLVGGIISGPGFCGDSVGLLGAVEQCEGPLEFTFGRPVDDLTFEQDGISALGSTSIEIDHDGGTATGGDTSLLTLSLLGLGGLFVDATALTGVTRVRIESTALVSTGGYVGDIEFTAPPVPVPATLPLLLGGLGAFAFARRRAG
jgi:hypothetical protein